VKASKYLLLTIVVALLFSIAAAADETDDRIAEINRAIAEQGADWIAARNPIYELPGEAKRRLTSLKFSEPSPGDNFFLPDTDGKQFPSHFDWREVEGASFVTPVRNQYQCGACWAFSVVGAFESLIAIREGIPDPDYDLSEQMMLSCTNAGNCTYGGYLNAAADALVDVGTIFEECLPYEARDDIPCNDRCDEWAEQIVTAKSWSWVGGSFLPPDVDTIKAAITISPIATGLLVFDDFMSYKGGVYEHVSGPLVGAHAITLIGWDDAQQCWIGKNSWGTLWGESGFFKIKWGNSFIGTSSVLLDYEAGNFNPPADDDDADDDVSDDDTGDGDSDKSSGGNSGCGC